MPDRPEITITLREFREYAVDAGDGGITCGFVKLEDAESYAIERAYQFPGVGIAIHGTDIALCQDPVSDSDSWHVVEILEAPAPPAPVAADFDCLSEDYLIAFLPEGWTYDARPLGPDPAFIIYGPEIDGGRSHFEIPIRFLSAPQARASRAESTPDRYPHHPMPTADGQA